MQRSLIRLGLATGTALMLAACAAPSKDISLIPTQTGDITSKDGVFTQPLTLTKTKPGCKGSCARIQVESLVFPGNRALTSYVDQQLAQMATFESRRAPSATVQEFMDYYWLQANDRDEVILNAKTRYRNQNITVLELGAWQYLTGAAHGMSEIRLINWDNRTNKPLSLEQIIQPRQLGAFEQQLRLAHQKWLATQEAAQENPENYNRLWPFQMTHNVGLTDSGLVAKYNSYEIAPYSSGQPELLIPYPQLVGILQPQFLPK